MKFKKKSAQINFLSTKTFKSNTNDSEWWSQIAFFSSKHILRNLRPKPTPSRTAAKLSFSSGKKGRKKPSANRIRELKSARRAHAVSRAFAKKKFWFFVFFSQFYYKFFKNFENFNFSIFFIFSIFSKKWDFKKILLKSIFWTQKPSKVIQMIANGDLRSHFFLQNTF